MCNFNEVAEQKVRALKTLPLLLNRKKTCSILAHSNTLHSYNVSHSVCACVRECVLYSIQCIRKRNIQHDKSKFVLGAFIKFYICLAWVTTQPTGSFLGECTAYIHKEEKITFLER